MAASFTRRRFGSKGCQRSVRPFACSVVIPSCRSLFSITSFPSATSSILWSGPTPIHDAASCGCPSFAAPDGNQPSDIDGPHRFRYVPFGRDVSLAPDGASGLSHNENGCAAFAGAGASSASATCLFRESISYPVRPLSTLRTPRCRDARKTRSRPACSALDGPDLHWQAHTGFSYRTPHPAPTSDSDGKALRPSVRAPASCDTLSRLCVRRVRYWIAFSSAPALRSIASAAGPPVLFGDFLATMTGADLSRPCIIGFGSSPSRCGPDRFSACGQA